MSTKITLPDDGWALLRDPAKVPERLRRPVTSLATRLQPQIRALQAVADAERDGDLTADAVDRFEELNDLAIVALVAEWSYDFPISVETVGDLPGDAYDELRRATAKQALALIPDFSPDPDPASPTGP